MYTIVICFSVERIVYDLMYKTDPSFHTRIIDPSFNPRISDQPSVT